MENDVEMSAGMCFMVCARRKSGKAIPKLAREKLAVVMDTLFGNYSLIGRDVYVATGLKGHIDFEDVSDLIDRLTELLNKSAFAAIGAMDVDDLAISMVMFLPMGLCIAGVKGCETIFSEMNDIFKLSSGNREEKPKTVKQKKTRADKWLDEIIGKLGED